MGICSGSQHLAVGTFRGLKKLKYVLNLYLFLYHIFSRCVFLR